MKKQLLLATAVAISMSASAQYKMAGNRAYAPIKPWQVVEPASTIQPTTGTGAVKRNGGNSSLSTIQIGKAQNALGAAFGAKTQLWADPQLNAVMHSHRNDIATNGGSSGDIRADVSTDGGATFTNDVLLYNITSNNSLPARYPQGAIYNPTGNTTFTDAYGILACPTLDGSQGVAGSFGGYIFNSNKLDLTNPALDVLTSDPSAGQFIYIANDMTITKTGDMHTLQPMLDLNTDYTDNMLYSKGVWNGTTNKYDYTHTLLPVPVSLNGAGAKVLADQRIAFADNGQIGYIVVLGHDDYAFSPDSTYYPSVWKTTDAGATWTGPVRINLSNLYSILTSGVPGDVISAAFEIDCVVDANNNLHIAMDVAFGGGFSISTAAGFHAICDIYTTDGGTSWFAQNMGYPQTFRGVFGDATTQVLNEDNRPQASRSWDGSRVFISWFDTDTNNIAGLGNTYPDIYSRGFNPSANTISTTSVAAIGEAMMGTVSYYTLGCGGSDYKVPASYQVISGSTPTGEPLNTLTTVQFFYNDDNCITDASYTPAPAGIILTGVSNPQVIKASSITVIPNPTSDFAVVSYLATASSEVKVNIVNILGETVASFNEGTKAPGMHQIKVDATQFAAGVYTVNFETGNQTATAKFVVK